MEFSKKLKELRLEKNLSQQKLADLIYVSRSAVAKWENGLGLPSKESYEVLAKVFGVSEEFFVTEEAEQVIITKNRKVKELSGTMFVAGSLFLLMLAAYCLFHPMPHYVTATCNEIEVQIWEDTPMHFSISDEEKIEELIDAINAATFRKSLRAGRRENYPVSMKALLMMRSGNGQNCTVVLCTAADNASVYVLSDESELTAVRPIALSEHITQLLEDETDGEWRSN